MARPFSRLDIDALERRYDGPVPEELRLAARYGFARLGSLRRRADSRLIDRLAQVTRVAIAHRRRAILLPEAGALAPALAAWRRAGVERAHSEPSPVDG